MNTFEAALISVTLAMFGASLYQAYLIRREHKLAQKPVLSFSLSFTNDRLNLRVTNIGNGLAKDIDLIISSSGEDSLHSKLPVQINGLGKNDCLRINDWQKSDHVGISLYEFDCSITGTCRDIFKDTHKINEQLHFENQ